MLGLKNSRKFIFDHLETLIIHKYSRDCFRRKQVQISHSKLKTCKAVVNKCFVSSATFQPAEVQEHSCLRKFRLSEWDMWETCFLICCQYDLRKCSVFNWDFRFAVNSRELSNMKINFVKQQASVSQIDSQRWANNERENATCEYLI